MLRWETWLLTGLMCVPLVGQMWSGDIDVHEFVLRTGTCLVFAWLVVSVVSAIIGRLAAPADTASEDESPEPTEEQEKALWNPPPPGH